MPMTLPSLQEPQAVGPDGLQRPKTVTTTREWGEDGPRLITVKTDRIYAAFHGTVPVMVLTYFEPPAELTRLEDIGALLTEELGPDWFGDATPPVIPDASATAARIASTPNPEKTRLLTLIAAWWTMTNMSSRMSVGEFVRLASSDQEQASFLFGEMLTRLHRLTVEALGEWPEAVLLPEVREFLESMMADLERQERK